MLWFILRVRLYVRHNVVGSIWEWKSRERMKLRLVNYYYSCFMYGNLLYCMNQFWFDILVVINFVLCYYYTLISTSGLKLWSQSTNKETLLGVHSLLSRDLVHLVDHSELCLPFLTFDCFTEKIKKMVGFRKFNILGRIHSFRLKLSGHSSGSDISSLIKYQVEIH